MTRRRSMHALLGTLALIAGCSTTHRTEVSGVVRDRATGRVIPGARVLGSDGALARTDAQGRFRLFVRPGSAADIRVSADGHAPEHVEVDGREASVELAATTFDGDSFVIQSPTSLGPGADLAVLGFAHELWGADGGADGGADDAMFEPESHVSTWTGDPSDGALAAGATCAGCHEDAVSQSDAHAGLADSCVACHADRLGASARSACGRCHGDEASGLGEALASEVELRAERASAALERAVAEAARARRVATSCGGVATRFTQVGGAFVLVDADGAIVGDCDRDRSRGPRERWATLEQLDPELSAAATELAWVASDPSGGAHAPDRARAILDALAP
jgi:hypothetical protein